MPQTRSSRSVSSSGGRPFWDATAAVDLRESFALQRRFLPAVFVFGAIGAISALDRAPAVWWWLAAFAFNAAVRFVVASESAQARAAVTPAARAAQLYLLTYVAELMLWAALLGSIVPQQRPGTSSIGFAAGGALLLSALALADWRRAWALYFAGWVALTVLVASRSGFRLDAFSVGFPIWLVAIGWIGRANAALRLRRKSSTLRAPADGRTRFGWTMAIRAVPSPVLVVRSGRVAKLNGAAAQLLGRTERELIGLRVDECLRAEPLEALDPLRTVADGRAVEITPLAGARTGWSGRVRVLQPGRADSALVIALTGPLQKPPTPAQALADDARRFADWIAGQQGEPWFRDGEGRLFVPPGLIAPDAPAAGPLEFPLLHAVEPAQRQRVNTAFAEALRAGRVFDQTVRLIDCAGQARELRVVCVARAATTAWPALIGTIAPAGASAAASAAAGADTDDLLARLPVLVWMIDASGRIGELRGKDPWRWGLVGQAEARPRWIDAFGFRDGARDDLTQAVAHALKGRPTFDLINARHTRAGGRIVLRSHVLPYVPLAELAPGTPDAPVALVLDTIASPQQLSEIDRLRRSKLHYKALVEASTSLISACDAQFNLTFASRRAAREIYGYEPRELIGRPVDVLLSAQVDQSAARAALESLRRGHTLRDVEMKHRAKDGQRLIVSVSAVPLKAGDGAFAGAIGMNADLTMLKQRERRLTEALRIERTVLDSAGQAIAVVKDGLVARCNDAFLQLVQALPAVLARTPIAEYFVVPEEWEAIAAAADEARGQDRAAVREVQIRCGAGALAAWCQLTARSIAPREYVLVLADIDHIRRREADALHEAQHDELTGLPNRRLLAARAASALAATALRNSQCAVIAIDLDGFKQINDQYGHKVGDTVLREVALRLARVLRPQDTVARRGGDEFAMLIPDVGTRTDVERIAVRILQSVAQPVLLAGGQPGTVSASLGIALAPEQGRDLERLLQLADLAMYEAKLKGKNRYAFATSGQTGVAATAAPRAGRDS